MEEEENLNKKAHESIDASINDIRFARSRVEKLDNSREKSIALTKLDEARLWLEEYKNNL